MHAREGGRRDREGGWEEVKKGREGVRKLRKRGREGGRESQAISGCSSSFNTSFTC